MHQQDYSQQSFGGQYYDNRPPMNEPHYGGHDNPAKKQRRTNVVAALEKHQQDISGQQPSRVRFINYFKTHPFISVIIY